MKVFCTFWLRNVLRAATACHFRHRNFKKWPEPVSFLTFSLTHVLGATAPCHFSTSDLQKVLQCWDVLYILTHEFARRHSGVPVFDILTLKSAPGMRCFVHFDLWVRLAPQRRAIYGHLNFKKWSEHAVFCPFWPIYTCAWRHSSVRFLISALSTWLRTRRFSKPTFQLSGTANHWKNTALLGLS